MQRKQDEIRREGRVWRIRTSLGDPDRSTIKGGCALDEADALLMDELANRDLPRCA